MKEEEEILAKNKDVSLLLQHSKLKKLAEARQVNFYDVIKKVHSENDSNTKTSLRIQKRDKKRGYRKHLRSFLSIRM